MTPVTIEKIKELALIPANFYLTIASVTDPSSSIEVPTRHTEEEIKSWFNGNGTVEVMEEGSGQEYKILSYRPGEGKSEVSSFSPIAPFDETLLSLTDGREEYGPIEPTASYALSIDAPDRYLVRTPVMETFDIMRAEKLDWKKGSVEVFTGRTGRYFVLERFDAVLVEVKESFVIPDTMEAFIMTNSDYSTGGITAGVKKLPGGFEGKVKTVLTNKGAERAVVYLDKPVLNILFVEK